MIPTEHFEKPAMMNSRRQFLKGTGVALALPMLESLQVAAAPPTGSPRRLLAICTNLGILPDRFFPETAGSDYVLSPYLEELAGLKEDFTVFSGVSHPGVDGSHASDVSFLTGAPHPASGGFRNSISLDQFVAEKIGQHTRFPSLTLGVNAKAGRRSLSWTGGGVLIPCEDKASDVFRKLFLRGSPQEIEHQMRRLKLGQSVMDTVAEQSRQLHRRLGVHDRERMDQYLTAVRDVEKRMADATEWEKRPKPSAPIAMPVDPPESSAFMEKTKLMYQMARLAFETDSTRSIALLLDANNSPTIKVDGAAISDGYHNLSHHGRNESKLKQLDAIDRAHLRLLAELLGDMKKTADGDARLLDSTAVIFGSNLGDANKHTTDNMPMLLAGGRFRHGQHLAFDRHDNAPLAKMYVSVLQQMGVETDQFASGTGTMTGLESKT